MDQEFADPRLSLLFDYWNAKRAGRPAPRREDLDPLEIPRLLPMLHLIDVEHDPLGFHHRLVGTELVSSMGRDVTGQHVDAGLYGPAVEEIYDTLRALVERVRPYRRFARQDWYERHWLTVEALELPLLGSDGEVAMILRGATFGVARPSLPQRLSFEPLAMPGSPVPA